MHRKIGSISFYVAFVAVLTYLLGFGLLSQTHAQAMSPLVTQYIDESKLVTLAGNTRPEAKPEHDRGAVAEDFRMEHMLLQLRRAPGQEQALQRFVDELHDPQSPNFHQWLTAQQFGERFGLAQQDIDTIVRWLESHGFQINEVYPSGILIDFSGTAGQVRQAFHTEIHHLEVNGTAHIANMRDPRLPAALAPAVVGIVSLHDFRPHPMVKLRGQYTTTNSGGTAYPVVPADLATIYNFTPVFNSGISGQGQTIVLVEDTDLFSTGDWSTFRSTFGLSGYTGSLSQVHPAPPSGANNCTDPGVNADDAEAILDAEYASAAAPSSAIEMASCNNTTTTFGGLIAIQNLINTSTTPPAIVSVSYGQCESVNGLAANAAYNSAYQQAVAEGVSVYVAAGDSGAAGCDEGQPAAANGIAVSAFASTPYNVAVGGTDFGDTYAGTNSTYWNSVNSSSYGSALSYVPEIPWNNSCAGALYDASVGYPSYGPNSLCNASGGLLANLLGVLTTTAGGGGPSSCAIPSSGGACVGYPKPSWQKVFGNPCGSNCGSSANDGVRDLPDVSLFAANGLWSHYYIFCYSDTANGGTACTGTPSGWTGAGGTSFSSPIMAGVQALVNQKMGARQGNPNPVFYNLAATEYGSGGNSTCNSSLGNAAAPSCNFYDVTLGDMAVDCTGNNNCFDSGSGYGVLSTSNSAYQPAYGAGAGWDFATGIGSLNVANLVSNWPGSPAIPDFSLSASPSSLTLTEGGVGGTTTILVTSTNGFTGSVSLSAAGQPSGVVASFNPSSTTSTSTLTLTASGTAPTGTFSLTITGTSGTLTHTTTVSLTVNAPTTITVGSSLNPSAYGQSVTLTATVSPSAATGTVQFFDGSSLLGTAALSGGKASLSILSFSVGSHSITAQYGGDSNFTSSTSAALTETVNTSTLFTLRVNAGGPSYVDSHGQTWQADTGYKGGGTFSTTSAVAGTSDPTLFQTERYGSPLQYSFSLPNGTYTVNLYFAEIWSGCFSAGCRVFNVQVQGTTAFSNLDVYAQAGANAALEKSATATVTNGTLTISFASIAQNPIINAIEIVQTAAAPTGTISGTVTKASDNTAISGATVSYSGGSTTTTSTGAYTLANVPAGTYTVTASATGFQTTSQPNVSVTGGSTTTTNFSLTTATGTGMAIRVNAGGPSYVDSHGQTWQADTGFTGGGTFSTTAAISGTSDPTLFRTERYGSPLQYSFSVPNGTYTVNLYFAEIWSGCFSVGCRVFNVQVQGTTAFSNLDVYAQAGANAALEKSATASVTNGTLTISFGSIAQSPMISAIEILQTAVAQAGTISGTVTKASDNTAISGAKVSYSGGSTTTNSTGVYTLANVPAGTYTVTASATGFQTTSQPNVSVSGGSTTTTNFSLTTATGTGMAIRVNAGGPSYVDSHGQTWKADTGFNGGGTFSVSAAITGTSDPALFQTERYGSPLQYSFSVPNGTYTVNLYFAEIWSGCFSVGCRVFNVLVQGTTAFSNLDVYAQAGANAALEKSATASVTNGTLTISFGSIAQNPMISAIEILQQ